MMTAQKIQRAYYVFQAAWGYWYIERLNDYRNNDVPRIGFDAYTGVYDSREKALEALAAAADQAARMH